MFTRCDPRLLNRKRVNFCLSLVVGYFGYNYLGLLQALVVVPMLVQSCLDAFLATVQKLRTAFAPLPESCCAAASSFGPRAARPQRPYRFVVRCRPSAHVPHAPRVVSSFSGSTCPSSFNKYTAETARGVLTLRSTTLLHNYLYIIVAMFAVLFVLLGNLTSVAPYRPELNLISLLRVTVKRLCYVLLLCKSKSRRVNINLTLLKHKVDQVILLTNIFNY